MKQELQVAAKALTKRGKVSKNDIQDILKKKTVIRSEILEFFEKQFKSEYIGGLKVLKVWLKQRYQAFNRS